MSETLDEIRKKIDAIDNQVHDLFMERASLVSSVAHAKKEKGSQIVQPAREANLVRRLLERHSGNLPSKTIVRIWRELISSVSLLQTGLNVVVADDERACNIYWDMGKNYFGSSVPMKKVKGNQKAISEVLENRASFAILPWPELDQESPWWSHLLNSQNDERLSIIVALPYEETGSKDVDTLEKGLVVSKIQFMPSDSDVSFIALEVNSQVSRARIKECAEAVGLTVLNLYSGTQAHDTDVKVHLLQVNGFVDQTSDKVIAVQKELGSDAQYCQTLGGYPVLPDIYSITGGQEAPE